VSAPTAETWLPDGRGLPEEARGYGGSVHLRLTSPGGRSARGACGSGLGELWSGRPDEVTCPLCRGWNSEAVRSVIPEDVLRNIRRYEDRCDCGRVLDCCGNCCKCGTRHERRSDQ